MIGLLFLFLALVASLFKSKSRLEAENAVLRHQLIVLRRKVQAGSGWRTTTASSWSNCIAGFRQSWMFSRSSGSRRSCVGIVPALAATGVGSHVRGEGDRGSRRTSVSMTWPGFF